MQGSLQNYVFITLMLGVMPVQKILKSEVRRVVASRKSLYSLVHIEFVQCISYYYIPLAFCWKSG